MPTSSFNEQVVVDATDAKLSEEDADKLKACHAPHRKGLHRQAHLCAGDAGAHGRDGSPLRHRGLLLSYNGTGSSCYRVRGTSAGTTTSWPRRGIESGGATACIRARNQALCSGSMARIDLLDDLRLRGRHRQLLDTADGLQGLRLDIGRRARNRVKTGFRGFDVLAGTTYTGPTACWISPGWWSPAAGR